MTNGLLRQSRFTTFDGTLSLVTDHQRPDRYSHLELAGGRPTLALRGAAATPTPPRASEPIRWCRK